MTSSGFSRTHCDVAGCQQPVAFNGTGDGAGFRRCLDHLCPRCHTEPIEGAIRFCSTCTRSGTGPMKQDAQGSSEPFGWGWVLFWIIGAPIVSMGGPFGQLLGALSLCLGLYGAFRLLSG